MFMAPNYKIYITTDMWESIHNLNYMYITISFVDNNWMLHNIIIGFMKEPDNIGTIIGREIKSSLLGGP